METTDRVVIFLDFVFSCGPQPTERACAFQKTVSECMMNMSSLLDGRRQCAKGQELGMELHLIAGLPSLYRACCRKSVIHGKEPDDSAGCITCEDYDCKMTHQSCFSSYARP